MSVLLCGKRAIDHLGATSPIGMVVALGYEDGPTTGALRCRDCSDAYRFDLLASDVDGVYDREAWDRGDELRIFGLAPLPVGAFDRIVALISPVDAPNWPVWVPGVNPPSPEVDRLVEAEIAPLLTGADQPQLVIATTGLLQPIVAVRDFPTGSNQTPSDWFALLGFAADERLVAAR